MKALGLTSILFALAVADDPATYYKRIDSWNMPSQATYSLELPSEIDIANILSVSAHIHSDPDGSGYIEVQNFEANGSDIAFKSRYRGRGGILEVQSGTHTTVNLQVYPPYDFSSGSQITPVSRYLYPSFSGDASCTMDPLTVDNTVFGLRTFTGTSHPRGYVKVSYLGDPLNDPREPIAVKSKVTAIGAWNMASGTYTADVRESSGDPWSTEAIKGKALGFSQFGIKADRILAIENSIMSDPEGETDTRVYTNFHRIRSGQGLDRPNTDIEGGGAVWVDEAKDQLILHMMTNIAWMSNFYDHTPDINFYGIDHSSTSKSRGYVRLDYIAGTCYDGPSGFKVNGVPGIPQNHGDCGSEGEPFVIAGAGHGIEYGETADSITFVSKPASQSTFFTVVRVDAMEDNNGSGWAALTVRGDATGAQEAHATVMVDGSSHVAFMAREGSTDANSDIDGYYTSGLPVWLALKRDEHGVTALWQDATGSETSPPDEEDANWSAVGSIDWPLGSNYSRGLAVWNPYYNGLEKVTFSQFHENLP